MRKMNIVWLSLLLAACNGTVKEPVTETPAQTAAASPEAQAAEGRSVRYERLHPAAHAAKRPVGMCELQRFLDGGAGVYKVVSLTGKTEKTDAGVLDGFTYVELERVVAWTEDAPERVVTRITGGPAGKGLTRAFAMELSVGETIGVMLYAPTEQNRGFHGMDTLGLFTQDERGGHTNGQLFLDAPVGLDAIGAIVRENASANGQCPHEVKPFEGLATPEFPAPSGGATRPVKVVLGQGSTPATPR